MVPVLEDGRFKINITGQLAEEGPNNNLPGGSWKDEQLLRDHNGKEENSNRGAVARHWDPAGTVCAGAGGGVGEAEAWSHES